MKRSLAVYSAPPSFSWAQLFVLLAFIVCLLFFLRSTEELFIQRQKQSKLKDVHLSEDLNDLLTFVRQKRKENSEATSKNLGQEVVQFLKENLSQTSHQDAARILELEEEIRRLKQGDVQSERPENSDWVFDIDSHKEHIYAQGDQDGVLRYIFSNIHPTNKYYVEFGFDSDGWSKIGGGANTRILNKDFGWNGLLLDGEHKNWKMNLHTEFIYGSNIVALFDKYGVPREVDYVSVDIDSIDVWVLRALLMNPATRFGKPYRPRVISAEFNICWGPNITLAFPNPEFGMGPEHFWDGKTAFFGNSAASLKMVAEESGYTAVYRLSKYDLFFIRNDLLAESAVQKLRSMWGKEFPFVWESEGINRGITVDQMLSYVDYKTWIETGDPIKASNAAWEMIWGPMRLADDTGFNFCLESAWKKFEKDNGGSIVIGTVPQRPILTTTPPHGMESTPSNL